MSRLSRLLSGAGLRLRKGLGQHFLVNPGALEKIADHVGASPSSIVIEIGCGVGNLTELLAARAGRVVAVELDERFRPIHQRELGALANASFIYGDFMKLDLETLLKPEPGREIRVVGNIPYHLTSPILFKMIESSVDCASVSLLMQREVAERLSAAPGSRTYGILAVKARTRFDVRLEFTISPGSFLPPPKVHSSLVRLTPRADGPMIADPAERRDFFTFVDAAFAQRRKTIGKSLEAAGSGTIRRESVQAALERAGLDPAARAESLSPARILDLFRALGSPRLPAVRKSYAS